MITVRSPLPSHLEIARRQMERYLERVTAIEAKVETERKRRLVAAFGDDVSRAEFARELLPRLVTAHRNDPLGPHQPGGEHAEEADRAVQTVIERLRNQHGQVGAHKLALLEQQKARRARCRKRFHFWGTVAGRIESGLIRDAH